MIGLTGGAAVVKALEAVGADVVFGIPGTHNLEIYRHLSRSRLRHLTPRHEQGAGYAADGYARVCGRPAVCVTTGGPGLTNIVTAVATAYADSIPMLVISPGVPRGTDGADLGLLHELRDQRSLMGSVVEHATRVDSADEAASAIQDAFGRSRVGRPRPEYIEIPTDVLERPWAGELPAATTLLPSAHPDRQAIRDAAELLSQAIHPVIVAGGGSRAASSLLLELAERLGSPVVTTVNGKGVIAETHPLSLGASLRHQSATRLIAAADVVLLVGTEFADTDLWGETVVLAGKVIRIDVDAEQLNKNVPASIALQGDGSTVVHLLLNALTTVPAGINQISGIERVRAELVAEGECDGALWRELQDAVRAGINGAVIVAGDSAMVSYLGTVHHWPLGPADRFLYPTGYATLGYGLPAAIGAKIAAPETSTVVLVGDGGFMFASQELVTAVENRLGLPVIVINNGGYRAIRDQMIERDFTPLGVELMTPDFAALGRACGANGVRLRGLGGLTEAVADAISAPAPTVIEVVVS